MTNEQREEFEFGVDACGDRILLNKETGGVYASVCPKDPEWWLSVSSAAKFSVAAWVNPDSLGRAIRASMTILGKEEG